MSPRARIALATCAELPDLDPDEAPLIAALHAAEMEPVIAVWDDPAVDWAAFDLVVVRCTWDYSLRREAFLEWATALPRLLNQEPVLRWNTDKHYLADLDASGLPVVETSFLPPGEAFVAAPDDGEYVVKPTVSSGSRDTARYGLEEGERARAHVESLQADGRVAMVQPYLDAVDTVGETALLFFDGVYSHAIRKGPLLAPGQDLEDGLFRAEDISPRDPSVLERQVAERVMDRVRDRFGPLLYSRVDLIPGPDGSPLLLELELTEPSLFFLTDDAAAGRMVQAIVGRLDSGMAEDIDAAPGSPEAGR
jgi:glutathione synthase/RimK-type ligase-like ATP-grasp enzyme